MAISIDANFPGGGVENVHFINDTTIAYTAPLDGGISNRTLWFCFRVKNAANIKLTLVQEKMERTLEVNFLATYGATRPVKREGLEGEWKRISGDDVRYNRETLDFSFDITPETNETYVAFCYPYQYDDFLKFIKNNQSPYMRMEIIGKSGEGRDYPMLFIGNFNDPTPKKLLIATARQHCGESPSSFVLEGFIKEAICDSEYGKFVRSKVIMGIVPLTNIDGAEEGRYGKDTPPVDFNRDWNAAPVHVEIRHVMKQIEKLGEKYLFSFYFDFHAPQPGGSSYIVPGRSTTIGEKSWKHVNEVALRFSKKVEDTARCRPEDLDKIYLNWGRENYLFTANQYLDSVYHVEGHSLETSYHLDGNGKLLTPVEWRFMGKKFLEAVCETYLEMECESLQNYNAFIDMDKKWDNWQMVSIPRNVEVSEAKGITRLTAQNGEGFIWFTDKRQVPLTKEDAYYQLDCCKGCAEVTLYAYYYSGNAPMGRSKPIVIELNRNDYCISIRALKYKFDCDSVRLSFCVNQFSGVLDVITPVEGGAANELASL